MRCCSAWHPDILRYILEHGAIVDMVNKRGMTALAIAAKFESPECMTLLLHYGANADASSNDGST
jgi:ankyrin repeat protein